MKKFSLTDSDITTNEKEVRRTNQTPSYWRKAGSVVATLAIGGALLTSCSDEKSCTDADRGADAYVYDTGPAQDPYDFGGDTDTGSADGTGRGYACRDYD